MFLLAIDSYLLNLAWIHFCCFVSRKASGVNYVQRFSVVDELPPVRGRPLEATLPVQYADGLIREQRIIN